MVIMDVNTNVVKQPIGSSSSTSSSRINGSNANKLQRSDSWISNSSNSSHSHSHSHSHNPSSVVTSNSKQSSIRSQISNLSHTTSFHDLKNAWETKSNITKKSASSIQQRRGSNSRSGSAAAALAGTPRIRRRTSSNRENSRSLHNASSNSYASQLYNGRNNHNSNHSSRSGATRGKSSLGSTSTAASTTASAAGNVNEQEVVHQRRSSEHIKHKQSVVAKEKKVGGMQTTTVILKSRGNSISSKAGSAESVSQSQSKQGLAKNEQQSQTKYQITQSQSQSQTHPMRVVQQPAIATILSTKGLTTLLPKSKSNTNLPPPSSPPPELTAFLSSPTGMNWDDLVKSLHHAHAGGGHDNHKHDHDVHLDREIEVVKKKKVYYCCKDGGTHLVEEDEISEIDDGCGYYDGGGLMMNTTTAAEAAATTAALMQDENDECQFYENEDASRYVGDNQFMRDVVTNYFEEKEAGAVWMTTDDQQCFDNDTCFADLSDWGEVGEDNNKDELSSISSKSTNNRGSISRMDSLEKKIEKIVTEQQQPEQATTTTTTESNNGVTKKITPLSPPPRKQSFSPRRQQRQWESSRRNNKQSKSHQMIGSASSSAFSPVKAASSLSFKSVPLMFSSPTTPGTAAMDTSFDSYSLGGNDNIPSPAQNFTSRKSSSISTPIMTDRDEELLMTFSPIEHHPNSPLRTPPPQPVSPRARRSPAKRSSTKNSSHNGVPSWAQKVHVGPRLPPGIITSQELTRRQYGHHHRGSESPYDPPIVLSMLADEVSTSCSLTDELLKHAELDPPLMMPLSWEDLDGDIEEESAEQGLKASEHCFTISQSLIGVYEDTTKVEVDKKDGASSIFANLVVAGSSERYEEKDSDVLEEEEDCFYNQIRGGASASCAELNHVDSEVQFNKKGPGSIWDDDEDGVIAPFPTCWDVSVSNNLQNDYGEQTDNISNVRNDHGRESCNNVFVNESLLDVDIELADHIDNSNTSNHNPPNSISKKNSVSASNTTERTSSSSMMTAGPVFILPQTLSTHRKNPTCWQIARHRIRRTKGEF